MESAHHKLSQAHHADASRPSLGFPLGTGLLLLVIFSLSGFFSCCYHWDKIRSLRRSFWGDIDHDDADGIEAPVKPASTYPDLKQNGNESLPVIMPGDRIAKFIALPCPCAPLRPENIILEVQTSLVPPSPLPPSPPPPPPAPSASLDHRIIPLGVYYNC
ncbi:hypothetical protein GIB67_010855 [Kingdonia uniflora]|uniref:Hydroxyproline-rich glycoprotein family protein n=1 Tax=Kingdonia uniflora TaxID=39325 RepID=A0A7J7PAF5_9MAGN|nr:hypothetical protein GIB67_010855 [Kingdonia uniflora]